MADKGRIMVAASLGARDDATAWKEIERHALRAAAREGGMLTGESVSTPGFDGDMEIHVFEMIRK